MLFYWGILRIVFTFKGEYQMREMVVDWGFAIEKTEKTGDGGDGGDLKGKEGTAKSWRYGILFPIF